MFAKLLVEEARIVFLGDYRIDDNLGQEWVSQLSKEVIIYRINPFDCTDDVSLYALSQSVP